MHMEAVSFARRGIAQMWYAKRLPHSRCGMKQIAPLIGNGYVVDSFHMLRLPKVLHCRHEASGSGVQEMQRLGATVF